MTTAWFCPSCQKHHAPHVETCPGGTGGVKLTGTFPLQACGCASPKCREEGCQAQRSIWNDPPQTIRWML